MPITPFSGVRISWLMLARNSDFDREASTASARARRRSVTSVAIVPIGVDRAVAVAQRELDEHERVPLAGLALVLGRVAGAQDLGVGARLAAGVVGGEQLVVGAAEDVAHAGRLLPGAADQQVAPVAVLDGDRRGRVLEDPLQAVGGDAQALLRTPLVGDVHARVDDVRDRAVAIEQAGARPRDQPGVAAGGQPLAFGGDRERLGAHGRELPAHRLLGSGRREHVPGPPPDHVLRRAAGQALAGPVEGDDRARPVEHEDERARGVDAAVNTSRSAFSAACAATRSVTSVATPRNPVTAPCPSCWTVTVIETRSRAAVLADEGPLPGLLALASRDGDEDLVPGLDAELRRALADLGAVEEQPGRRDADDLFGVVAEHPLRAAIEQRDRSSPTRGRRRSPSPSRR